VRLRGGYTAYRNFLIQSLDSAHKQFNPIILGGRTGCGKTLQLQEIPNAIDLEALANHRGSSFGRRITPQTSPIDFENNLAYAMIQKIEQGAKHIVFEDEGKHIGNVFMPHSFISAMSEAMILILETPMDERVDITLREYVIEAQNIYGKEGFLEWQESIKNSMKKIEKRLGGEKYRVVFSLFEEALREQMKSGSYEKYRDWIEYLLREYYDPMYDYQIEKRSQRVRFRGNASEIKEYIKNLSI
jgi:tRNA 2-selenouridine synthase